MQLSATRLKSVRNAHLNEVAAPRSLSKWATAGEARDWGRMAARLGWGLDSLNEEVEEEFHQVAIEAYNARLATLRGGSLKPKKRTAGYGGKGHKNRSKS